MSDEFLKQIAETMAQQNKLMEQLIAANDLKRKEIEGNTLHTKTPANAHTGIQLHGAGGVFSGPGLERDVITAHVRPYGLADSLPLIPSVNEDPRFASLTGFTDDMGDEPTYICQDAPTGYIKGCNLTARFGWLRRDTNTIDMDKVMLRVNRGDFTDLILRGKVLGLANLEPSGLDQGQLLNIITMAEMVSVGVRVERNLNKQLWQGVLNVRHQFPGLDVQIATGQIDADTAVACPALDSDVKNYNYALLSSTIVDYMSALEFYLKNNAITMGLDPVQWVWVMRPELWFELTDIWPCAYNTNKCAQQVMGTSTVAIDGRENITDRDNMRNGMYIDVNGTRYPVIVDTGIFEHTNVNNANVPRGQYASTIYFVPLTITGGFPVTYREYVDYRQAAGDVNLLKNMEQFFWTDNGVFSWALEQVKWCYKLAIKTEQRVILRTPQLAGRIDAVRYAPLQHLRDADPSSSYFKDGGVSVRGGLASPKAVWGGRW